MPHLSSQASVEALLRDPLGVRAIKEFAQTSDACALKLVEFVVEVDLIVQGAKPGAAPNASQLEVAKRLHARMRGNPLFYFAETEIVIGDIMRTDFDPIVKNLLDDARPRAIQILAGTTPYDASATSAGGLSLFERFLRSRHERARRLDAPLPHRQLQRRHAHLIWQRDVRAELQQQLD